MKKKTTLILAGAILLSVISYTTGRDILSQITFDLQTAGTNKDIILKVVGKNETGRSMSTIFLPVLEEFSVEEARALDALEQEMLETAFQLQVKANEEVN